MSGLQPQPQDQSASAGYPVMGFDEMEGYLFESLEIIATTPISQYYGPENDESEVDTWPCNADPNLQSDTLSPSLLTATAAPSYERWDKKNSFQKVHQRAIEGHQQPQEQQSCYLVSPTTSNHSSGGPAPTYTQLNQYHSNIMPQYPSSEGSDSQQKVEDPALKRMRNTAASARFRAKKKRQEQQLQQTARENQEALDKLRNRVAELETENRWLKNLILDKSEATKRKDSEVSKGDRKGSEHKDGIGT